MIVTNQTCCFLLTDLMTAQQNSYCISHLLGTVTTWWLDSDSIVTVANCRQHGDWAANCSVVTVLLAVNNGDYTVTVQHSNWWKRSFAVVVHSNGIFYAMSMCWMEEVGLNYVRIILSSWLFCHCPFLTNICVINQLQWLITHLTKFAYKFLCEKFRHVQTWRDQINC